MCEFVSWIEMEKDHEILFMQNKNLDTYDGEELVEHLKHSFYEDITGHGTIRKYFGIKPNMEWEEHEEECLANPKKFPAVIVEAIKKGNMSRIGMPSNPRDLLNPVAVRAFKKGCQKHYDEYDDATDITYKNITSPLVLEKVNRGFMMQQKKKNLKLFWDLFKNKANRKKAWQ